LFTNLLLDHLKAAESARIINVASEAHRAGEFDPVNLQLETGFQPFKAYGNSKLFNQNAPENVTLQQLQNTHVEHVLSLFV
jgi:NAD(P)-dependent dehydrogenase (short-subunit alcohol dehydrogenase family)